MDDIQAGLLRNLQRDDQIAADLDEHAKYREILMDLDPSAWTEAHVTVAKWFILALHARVLVLEAANEARRTETER